MTDTVKVPRGWLEKMLASNRLYSFEHNEIRALLAAAPKAEPVEEGCPLCSGDCGAANPPVLDCPLQSKAEAPKVEQEPVAYVSRKGFTTGGLVWTKEGRDADLPDETKLYTHPAPASDELLEAIAKDAAERVHKNGGCVPQLAYAPILFALQDAFAKHKEPQS